MLHIIYLLAYSVISFAINDKSQDV